MRAEFAHVVLGAVHEARLPAAKIGQPQHIQSRRVNDAATQVAEECGAILEMDHQSRHRIAANKQAAITRIICKSDNLFFGPLSACARRRGSVGSGCGTPFRHPIIATFTSQDSIWRATLGFRRSGNLSPKAIPTKESRISTKKSSFSFPLTSQRYSRSCSQSLAFRKNSSLGERGAISAAGRTLFWMSRSGQERVCDSGRRSTGLPYQVAAQFCPCGRALVAENRDSHCSIRAGARRLRFDAVIRDAFFTAAAAPPSVISSNKSGCLLSTLNSFTSATGGLVLPLS